MNPPYIPATALSGDLVRDWTGPVLGPDPLHHMDPSRPALKQDCLDGTVYKGHLSTYGGRLWLPENVHLDPHRPEVAHRIADVLRSKGHEVGHLLPVALGGRQGDVTAYEPCERCESAGGTCYRCREGSEMDRPPRRTIPAADVSALTLAASVAGVEAGRGVVRGVLGEWTNDHGYWVRTLPATRHIGMEGVIVNDSGWRVPTARIDPYWTSYGPETGAEGRAAADAALLRLGYAYLDPAAPFGVVAPFLRDGREVGS